MEIGPRIAKAEQYINRHKLATVAALGLGAVAAGIILPEGGEKVFSQECVYRPGVKQSIRAHFYTRGTGEDAMVRKNEYLEGGYSLHSVIREGTIYDWVKRGDKVIDARKMPATYNGLPEFFSLDKRFLKCREWDISESNFHVPANIGFTEVQGGPMTSHYNILATKK